MIANNDTVCWLGTSHKGAGFARINYVTTNTESKKNCKFVGIYCSKYHFFLDIKNQSTWQKQQSTIQEQELNRLHIPRNTKMKDLYIQELNYNSNNSQIHSVHAHEMKVKRPNCLVLHKLEQVQFNIKQNEYCDRWHTMTEERVQKQGHIKWEINEQKNLRQQIDNIYRCQLGYRSCSIVQNMDYQRSSYRYFLDIMFYWVPCLFLLNYWFRSKNSHIKWMQESKTM